MERMTVREVEGMFSRASRAAKRVGLDVEGWTVVQGSVTYGRQWRLVRVLRPSGGEQDLHRLGSTAREAYDTLYALAWAWEEASDVSARTRVDSPSGWSYMSDQENGDQVDCRACGDPLIDDLLIVNDAEGYAYHEACTS